MTKKLSPAACGVPFQGLQSLFNPGKVYATQGVLAACTPQFLNTCINRHLCGDWGCISPEDRQQNSEALVNGDRLLSAYAIDSTVPCPGWGDNCLWIITESDRSVTTFLLPGEY